MRAVDKVAVVVGFVLLVLVGAVPYAVSGLVAPLWGVGVLWLSWIALLVVAVVLQRRGRYVLVPLVPIAALAWWLAVVSFGSAVFGWTA